MPAEERLGLQDDLLAFAAAGNHNNFGTQVWLPHEGVFTLHRLFHAVECRRIKNDHVVISNLQVVNDTFAREFNRNGSHMLAAGIEDLHPVIGAVPALCAGHQLAGHRAHLGMRGKRVTRLQGAVVVVQADRGQVRVEQVRKATLPHRQQFVPVIHDIGIGGIANGAGFAAGVYHILRYRQQLADATVNGAIEFALGLQVAGLYPAVLVLYMAILEVDGVHHAIAVQRVDIMIGLVCHVGAIAHVGAEQLLGHSALHPQLCFIEIPFLVDGGVVSLQIGESTQIHEVNLSQSD